LDKENEIVNGLPEKFDILSLNPYYNKGFNATTEVGWQLSFPKLIMNRTYISALKIANIVSEIGFIEDIVEEKSNINKNDLLEKIINSLKGKMHELYHSIISSNIDIINGTLKLKLLNKDYNLYLKSIISKLPFYLPVNLIAISSDGLAGIIAYDKFFDKNGYRSVYFSFEPEANIDKNSWILLLNAIEWVKKWEFKDITYIENKISEKTSQYIGSRIFSERMLLNEEGYNIIEKDVVNGKYNILIVHPNCEKIDLHLLGNEEILEKNIVTNGITEYIVLVKGNKLAIGIKSDQELSLNPAYIEIWSQQPAKKLSGNIEVYPSFDKKSYSPGDKGVVTLTITNKESVKIEVTYVGIWFSWLKEGYYYGEDYTKNPIYLNVNETQDFHIPFEIDKSLTQGTYEYSLLIVYKYEEEVCEYKSTPKNILIEQIKHFVNVAITLVDSKNRPISGAIIKIADKTTITDFNGKAIFMNVPMEVGGTSYDVSAEKNDKEIAKATIIVSPTRTEFTIIGNVYDLRVQVVGAAGQGLPSSTVVVKRAGVPVATLTTDPNGIAVVPQLIASDYEIEVLYKGFSGSASISASDLAAGKSIVIELPISEGIFELIPIPLLFLIIVSIMVLTAIIVIILVRRRIRARY
jgi:hypothetical protein